MKRPVAEPALAPEIFPARREPAPRISDRMLIGVLALLAVVPYLNIAGNGFVYDDEIQVLRNPFVRDLHHLRAIFTTTVWAFQGGAQGVTNYYRPVMALTYAICHEIFGFRALGFHLTSIAFHAGVVCLLYAVTKRLFGDRTLAFLASALFAVHPIHTEAVDWIAAITDLEATFFFLLAFWFFLRMEDTPAGRRPLLSSLMLLSFGLALLSKESAATLPLIAAIYEHTCRGDRRETPVGEKIRRYGALWLLLIAYLVIRTRVLGAFAPVVTQARMAPAAVVLSALALAGRYVEKMFWPVHLSAAYVFPQELAALLPRILAGLGIAAACVLIILYFWARDRRLFFACAWFFVTLAPVLNVRWMPDFAFAERYAYLPSVGFCWVVCRLGLEFARKRGVARPAARRAAAAAACLVAALMIARIALRNRDWKNDFTFYTATLKASPSAVTIRNDFGNYYWLRGDLAAAGDQWQDAYQVNPNATYVLDNLGLLRLRQKRYGEAAVYFRRALGVSDRDENAHDGLGDVYQALGRRREAEQELLTAIQQAPLDVRPRVSLGELCFDEGRYTAAVAQFNAANRLLPTARAYYGLGLTEWTEGDSAKAEDAFRRAQRQEPRSGRPYFMLGLFYGATGRIPEAITAYETGLRFDPGDEKARAALVQLQDIQR
ncbi:MAG: tetratricopeptide repeat protein [Terriglobia bacterium]